MDFLGPEIKSDSNSHTGLGLDRFNFASIISSIIGIQLDGIGHYSRKLGENLAQFYIVHVQYT